MSSFKTKFINIPPYRKLSKYYDFIISPDYEKFISFFSKLKNKFSISFDSVLDIGCGNGKLDELFAKKFNSNIIAVDLSKDMIKLAKKNNISKNIKFVNKDIFDLNFKTNFSFVLFLNTGINYVLYKKKIKELFKKVYNLLDNNGFFFFDVSTEKNIIDNYVNQIYYGDIDKNIKYIIQSKLDNDKGSIYFEFYENDNFFIEEHKIRIYECSFLAEELNKIFSDVYIFDSFSFSKPKNKSYIVSFLCRK